MSETAPSTQLHRKVRLHAASILYFLSRTVVVAFAFSIPVLYFLTGEIKWTFIGAGGGLVALLFTGYYLTAVGLHCAACSSPVLLDNGNAKHRHAARLPGLNYRARVAWDILFGRSYQCMYCNTRCRSKRNWEGQTEPMAGFGETPFQQAVRPARAETFPASIFAEPSVNEIPAQPGSAAPAIPEHSASIPERIVSPGYAAASVFPGGRTAPISVPGPNPLPVVPSLQRRAVDSDMESLALEPPTIPPPATGNPFPAVPWTAPDLHQETTPDVTPMSRPSSDQHQPVQGPNPFLASTAAVPPLPGPLLSQIPTSQIHGAPEPVGAEAESASFRQEFPSTAIPTAPAGSPPPWTLPSMVLPISEHGVPLPESREFEQPIPPVPPATLLDLTPTAGGSLSSEFVKEVLGALQEGHRALSESFESVIRKLENRLAAIPLPTAPVPAKPVTQPVQPATTEQTASLVAIPISSVIHPPEPVALPAPVQFVEPVALQSPPVLPPMPVPPPEPVALPAPVLFTEPVELQSPPVAPPMPVPPTEPASLPAPVLFAEPDALLPDALPEPMVPPPPIPLPAPAIHPRQIAPPVSRPAPMAQQSPDVIAPTPMRRRFARPKGLIAEQLNSALVGVFETPPDEPATPPHENFHAADFSTAAPLSNVEPAVEYPLPPLSPESIPLPAEAPPRSIAPPGFLNPTQRMAVPDPQPSSPVAESRDSTASPFEILNGPLTAPPEVSAIPAPFTFLQNNGNHFTPIDASKTPEHDPLDDAPLPWMQPIGS